MEDSGSDSGSQGGYGNRQMYDATCSDCGAACQVPFQPTAGRPVYCRNCYQNHKKPNRRY